LLIVERQQTIHLIKPIIIVVTHLMFGKSAFLLLLAACFTAAAPSTNKVLILKSTITEGLPLPGGSYESQAVLQLGLVPEIVDSATWSTMTAAQFGSYRAIVLGDPTCQGLSVFAAAQANSATWMPQVTGPVTTIGTDPVFHVRFTKPSITPFFVNAINFTVSDPTKVGAYLCLSCAYDSVPLNTPIPMLAPLGAFTARGVNCWNDAHIVAVHNSLAGMTDSILSGWSCSVHNGFQAFPASFLPLAIARNIGGAGTLPFADGSSGVPFILARGARPVLCGDGILQSPEECDNGASNGLPGNACSNVCRLHWCGDGVKDLSEGCDFAAMNGAPGSTCSSSCTVTGPVCTPGCSTNGNCTFLSDNVHTHCLCASGWAGPDCTCSIPSHFLSTDHPPKLDVARSGFEVKDELKLTVNVSAKYYNVQITFKNEKNASCNFPATTGVNFWTPNYYGPSQCEWSVVGRIPWGVAWSTCLFQRDETDNYITFSGEMDVYMTEDLGSIRGVPLTRTHLHTLPFSVVFPKHVSVVSDDLTVYSSYVAKAAIVDQSYTSTDPPNGKGTVRLYTSVQWPYVLQAPLASTSDNIHLPITVSGPELVPDAPLCPNDGTSACQQHFNFEILPDIGQCNLNGHYMFNFKVGCHPSIPAASCPLLTPDSGAIAFSLQSSWICQQIVANVDLAAEIEPYATAAFDIEKYDFVVGAPAFYLVHTRSTQVSITGTFLSTIAVLAPNGTSTMLYDAAAGGNTGAGNAMSLTINNGFVGHGTPQNDATFSILYDPVFFATPGDSITHWTFTVVCNVVFFNTQPAAFKPITMMQRSTLTLSGLVKERTDKRRELEAYAAKALIKYVAQAGAGASGADATHSGKNLKAQTSVVLTPASDQHLDGTSDAAVGAQPGSMIFKIIALLAVTAFTILF
jgi:cysteine-rich repeat protein